jgi:hypothetical protein
MPEPNIRILNALGRLRKIETDMARRDLGETLEKVAALAERDVAIAAQVEAARQFIGDFDRQAFIRWLDRMWAERTRLAESLRVAEALSEAARSVLARRRVAETATEQALAAAELAQAAEVARRDQVMLEDVARALKRAADAPDDPTARACGISIPATSLPPAIVQPDRG